jgi:hypothetical protein
MLLIKPMTKAIVVHGNQTLHMVVVDACIYVLFLPMDLLLEHMHHNIPNVSSRTTSWYKEMKVLMVCLIVTAASLKKMSF